METLLAAIAGAMTGLALGLTGGGGTMLAVPALQHGVGLGLDQATVVSLAAVGALSLVGGLNGLRHGDSKPLLAVLIAMAGWIGAPFGAWLHSVLPAVVLLAVLTLVLGLVAVRMWRGTADPALNGLPVAASAPACRFAGDGRLDLTTRCGRNLAVTGLAVGVLSGLIGVGGGFLIVPALLRLSGLPLRAAVATSLLVVALVSVAGLVSHLVLGHRGPLLPGAAFVVGGLAGLAVAIVIARHLSALLLRRGFAAILVLVAIANVAMAFIHRTSGAQP